MSYQSSETGAELQTAITNINNVWTKLLVKGVTNGSNITISSLNSARYQLTGVATEITTGVYGCYFDIPSFGSCLIFCNSVYAAINIDAVKLYEVDMSDLDLMIITQPVDYYGTTQQTAEFSVLVQGSGVSYQWQFRPPSQIAWADTGAHGSNTNRIYDLQIASSQDGKQFRCIVTKGTETIISSIGTIHMIS